MRGARYTYANNANLKMIKSDIVTALIKFKREISAAHNRYLTFFCAQTINKKLS